MRALLVGLGSIGKRHLRNLRQILPEAEVTVLRHRRADEPDPAESLANRLVYSLDDALREPLDFALIASPSPFHVDSALRLAHAGAHLFIEKPISNRLEGVDELLAVCRQRRLALMVGYPLRFDRTLNLLRAAILDGSIGDVVGLRSEVGQYLPDWRERVAYHQTVSARRDLGGGVLLELSHELDCARWLVGEVTAVNAMAARVSSLDIDVDDWADVHVQFAEGAVGHIHLDMVDRAPTRSCRIIGSRGTLTWESRSNHVRRFSAATRQWEEIHPPTSVDRNDMYVDELNHFLRCVRDAQAPMVTGEDGKRALQIALAADYSARQGATVPI